VYDLTEGSGDVEFCLAKKLGNLEKLWGMAESESVYVNRITCGSGDYCNFGGVVVAGVGFSQADGVAGAMSEQPASA
jgi:hypothetical protein